MPLRNGGKSRSWALPFRSGAALLAPVAFSGCIGELSALDPAGPAAGSIADLWWAMLAGGVFLFALVMGLYALTMLRPGFGSGFSTTTWIVAGGVVMPIPILTVLVHYSLFQGERLLPSDQGMEPIRIEARARQWEWEFFYLDEPGTPSTMLVMHIPAGHPIDVVATSEDVIHSFWVPRLGGKVDATPGHRAMMRLSADRTGSYRGICAEYCGLGHAIMPFQVQAHEMEEYRTLAEEGFGQ